MRERETEMEKGVLQQERKPRGIDQQLLLSFLFFWAQYIQTHNTNCLCVCVFVYVLFFGLLFRLDTAVPVPCRVRVVYTLITSR